MLSQEQCDLLRKFKCEGFYRTEPALKPCCAVLPVFERLALVEYGSSLPRSRPRTRCWLPLVRSPRSQRTLPAGMGPQHRRWRRGSSRRRLGRRFGRTSPEPPPRPTWQSRRSTHRAPPRRKRRKESRLIPNRRRLVASFLRSLVPVFPRSLPFIIDSCPNLSRST